MRKITEGFCAWCADNSRAARFERTVAQGIIAAVAAGLATSEWGAAFIVAIVMAVLSPVQHMIGEGGTIEEEGDE